jgi:hypothetical protein
MKSKLYLIVYFDMWILHLSYTNVFIEHDFFIKNFLDATSHLRVSI